MLVEKIRAIFAGHVYDDDPIHIISSPENQYDEYDMEIAMICKRVETTDTAQEIQQKIYEVFCEQFDKQLAGDKSNYLDLAYKLHSIIADSSSN